MKLVRAFWESAPLLARIATGFVALGIVVSVGERLGVRITVPGAAALFLAAHVAVMMCFFTLWLRLCYLWILGVRARPRWDPLAPRNTWRIPWIRFTLVAASIVHVLASLPRDDSPLAAQLSRSDVRSAAAGWVMLAMVIAVAAGPLEQAIRGRRHAQPNDAC
jgi:hypothetical protein